jgi:hypothetical protein
MDMKPEFKPTEERDEIINFIRTTVGWKFLETKLKSNENSVRKPSSKV